MQRGLLDVGQHVVHPSTGLTLAEAAIGIAHPTALPTAGGKVLMHIVVVEKTEANLLEVVLTLAASGRLAGCLHSRQQQRDQDADDGDHDQQLDQCECSPVSLVCHQIGSPWFPPGQFAGYGLGNLSPIVRKQLKSDYSRLRPTASWRASHERSSPRPETTSAATCPAPSDPCPRVANRRRSPRIRHCAE